MAATELNDQYLVDYLAEAGQIDDSRAFCEEKGFDHDVFVGTMNSLLSLSYITSAKSATAKSVLTDEGAAVVAEGSPEYRLYLALPEEGAVPIKELSVRLPPPSSLLARSPPLPSLPLFPHVLMPLLEWWRLVRGQLRGRSERLGRRREREIER